YPARSSAPTTCSMPNSSPNSANCQNAVPGLEPVGSYTGSASPSGTFDQGGNLVEWNEAIFHDPYCPTCSICGIRGGSYVAPPNTLGAAYRGAGIAGYDYVDTGFRLAMIPEPSSGVLVAAGLLVFIGSTRLVRALAFGRLGAHPILALLA